MAAAVRVRPEAPDARAHAALGGRYAHCPFDPAYGAIFRAVVFAVHDCGFRARSALEIHDDGELRIAKIVVVRDWLRAHADSGVPSGDVMV